MSLTALHEVISIGKEKANNYLSEYTKNKNEILYFNTKMSDVHETNSQKEAEYRQKRDDYLPTKRACIEWLVPPVDKSNPAYSDYILKYQDYAGVYCAHFLAWIFNLAGYKNLYCGGKAERSVEGVKSYYQQRGQYFKKGTSPIQIGDLIMFHTGRSKSDSGVKLGIVTYVSEES